MSILLNIDQRCREAFPELDDAYVSALAASTRQLSDAECEMLYDEQIIFESFCPMMAELEIPRNEWIPSLEPIIMRVMSRKYPSEERYRIV